MNTNVLMAVFRRNFVSYFANPTGYVFICVFVLLGAWAAFWPPDFFNNNLANLDQLNYWFPFIMLVFIPTITMGIWADERKQGTDELLLTIPAADFDIVLGKYLAAVVIFSVSLLFSMVCNLAVLEWLGQPDKGLLFGTYIGYWLIGAAMLAIGMVASFLTNNITIGFIVGVILNMPLVFFAFADMMAGTFGRPFTQVVMEWSIGQQFADFGRGVLTLAGLSYFLMVLAVMLYVSMVLIGRRHWFSGEHRWRRTWHFVVRTLALATVAGSIAVVIQNHDFRLDVTSEKLSSLSPQTVALIRDLKTTRPLQIDAYISPEVPENYVQTRLNLLAMLREIQAIGGKNVHVEIHSTERFSKEAELAEQRFGIEPRQVSRLNRGVLAVDHIFLNVAITGGPQSVPPVFIDRGIPVEYELVRSLCTATQEKRKKVGVLKTDVELFGGVNMQTFSPIPGWPIIDELEKQYEVVKVDPAKPITEKFDVLLAVQPSSLGPPEMDNFVAAVAGGQPTAVFEDPAPLFGGGVPATSAPRQSGGNPMFGGARQLPKGNIEQLWKLLGITFIPDQVVWQDYNPIPKASNFPKEFVFVDNGCGAKKPFDESDEISSGLQHILFPFPGAVAKLHASSLQFTPLVETGEKTGTVAFKEIVQMTPFGPRGGLNPNRRQNQTNMAYVLAAHIRGEVKPPPSVDEAAKENDTKADEDAEQKAGGAKINVVVVADLDMFSPEFFRIREQGNIPEMGIQFDFDNVTFVLNILDDLAGDQRFVDIRKRRPQHRTLTRIEERTAKAKEAVAIKRKEFEQKLEDDERQEEKQINEKIAELRKRKNMDVQQMLIEVEMMSQDLKRRKDANIEKLKREKDDAMTKIETDLAFEIRRVQDQYKLWAVLLPPILPLALAIGVYLSRRAREREGVSRSRLRS